MSGGKKSGKGPDRVEWDNKSGEPLLVDPVDTVPFNPLDTKNLGIAVAKALLEKKARPLGKLMEGTLPISEQISRAFLQDAANRRILLAQQHAKLAAAIEQDIKNHGVARVLAQLLLDRDTYIAEKLSR